jgi:hypothetical protein
MHRRTLLLTGFAAGVASRVAAAEMPVVLELFTSQGCSSCPPADALLGELTQRPNVIALAWHVDYWNSLGWRDPYASRQWTDRQRTYAAHLKDEVYTPALVVNGASMVVGSDRAAVRSAVRTAPNLSIPVKLTRAGDRVEAVFGPSTEGLMASLVVYDPQTMTNVGAGENSGRRLVEYRIVREVRSIDPTAQGRIELPGIKSTQGAVLLLQDADWRVRGAADLKPI